MAPIREVGLTTALFDSAAVGPVFPVFRTAGTRQSGLGFTLLVLAAVAPAVPVCLPRPICDPVQNQLAEASGLTNETRKRVPVASASRRRVRIVGLAALASKVDDLAF